MPEKNYLKVIQSAKEDETAAADFYEKAARAEPGPVGENLFLQLAGYERFHFEKLASLERNLAEKGAYIKYERQEPPAPPRLVFRGSGMADDSGILKILKQAVEMERETEKLYLDLADQIAEPDGHYMFSRLAEEEHLHFHILKEIIWNLRHTGSWEWAVH